MALQPLTTEVTEREMIAVEAVATTATRLKAAPDRSTMEIVSSVWTSGTTLLVQVAPVDRVCPIALALI